SPECSPPRSFCVPQRLLNSEIDLEVGPDRHRLALRANGWLEPPISCGLNRLFVQAVTQRTLDLDIRGLTFGCDDHVEHNNSRDLRGPRLVGIRRIRTCNALREANPSDAYYVSAVYEHRGLGGFIRGLALRGTRGLRKRCCRRLRRAGVTKIARQDCGGQVDGSRPIRIETYQRSYPRPSHLSLHYIWPEFPLAHCIHRRLNEQRRTIKHTRILAHINLWRNAQANIDPTRYVRNDGKRRIPRKSTLRYTVPHFLRRNVLNPSQLRVCWDLRLIDLCRRQ